MSISMTAGIPNLTELLIGGTWTDVTATVRDTPADPGPVIERGQPDESGLSTSTCNLTLSNATGIYSDRLPTSPNYRLLGRNTQLRHRIRWVYDTMDRNIANSWGSATSGQVWTNTGTAGDYFGDGVRMFHKHTNRNFYRSSTVALPVGCADVTATFSAPTPVTGGSIYFETVVGSDLSNYYTATATFTTGGTVTLGFGKRVGGALSSIDAPVTVGATGILWSVRLQRTPTGYLRAKAWPASTAQPAAWTTTTSTADTSLSTFTTAGVRSLLDVTNTNALDVFLAFWDFDVSSYRFWGEVPSWPQEWDRSPTDVTAPIQAAGLLRRLGGKGAQPLRSPLYRTMSGAAPGDYRPFAYWPMEDGSDATQFASAVPGVPPLGLPLGVTPGTDSGLAGSEALPTFVSTAVLPFTIPTYVNAGQCAIQFVAKIGAEPGAETTLVEFYASSGPIRLWRMTIAPGAPAIIWMYAFDAAGAAVNSPIGVLLSGSNNDNPAEQAVFGHHIMFTFAPQQVGGNVDSWFGVCSGPPGEGIVGSNVDAGTLGLITGGKIFGTAITSVGHLGVYTDGNFDIGFTGDSSNNIDAMLAYTGETAADRLTRLHRENGLYFELTGDAADTARLGPQPRDTFLNVVVDAVHADGGVYGELRDAFGLGYRTRTSLYNQPSAVSLSYSGDQLTALRPVEDDQKIVNDVTARRPGGSFAHVEVTTGPLSTQDPPTGIGTIEEDLSWNVESDLQLTDIAGQRARIGTIDQPRFPDIGVNMLTPAVAANPNLIGLIATVDLGTRVTVTGPPAWMPPDDINAFVDGYSETLSKYAWQLHFNTSPADVWDVGVLEDAATGKLDTAGMVLAAGYSSSATSMKMATTAGPLATEDSGQYPADVNIAGERNRITAMTHQAITFIAAGASSTGSSGSRTPGGPAGGTAGDLILIFASSRSLTATVNTPTDWTQLLSFGNCALLGRIYDGVWAMPTVTFAGDTANEDTIAQSAMIRGQFYSLSTGVVTAAATSILNGSAQDIAYPQLKVPRDGCVVFYLGWKQDDYTSVATIGGATEIQEAFSVAGNDAAQIWDYVIQTTRADIPSGVFTVTGGAAAVSRGAVVAIGFDTQTATVTRNVNGLPGGKAQTAGEAVSLWRKLYPGR